jgi:hypothetical protein
MAHKRLNPEKRTYSNSERQRLYRQGPTYKKYIEKNRQKIKEHKRNYYLANRDRFLAAKRIYTKNHRKQAAAWYQANKERLKVAVKEHRKDFVVKKRLATNCLRYYYNKKASDPTYQTKVWYEKRGIMPPWSRKRQQEYRDITD